LRCRERSVSFAGGDPAPWPGASVVANKKSNQKAVRFMRKCRLRVQKTRGIQMLRTLSKQPQTLRSNSLVNVRPKAEGAISWHAKRDRKFY